jgi:hypothetical protein
MNRRKNTRIAHNAKVLIQNGSNATLGQYLDISEAGALVQDTMPVTIGEEITLMFQVHNSQLRRFSAKVVRVEGGQVALAFKKPLTPQVLNQALAVAA